MSHSWARPSKYMGNVHAVAQIEMKYRSIISAANRLIAKDFKSPSDQSVLDEAVYKFLQLVPLNKKGNVPVRFAFAIPDLSTDIIKVEQVLNHSNFFASRDNLQKFIDRIKKIPEAHALRLEVLDLRIRRDLVRN